MLYPLSLEIFSGQSLTFSQSRQSDQFPFAFKKNHAEMRLKRKAFYFQSISILHYDVRSISDVVHILIDALSIVVVQMTRFLRDSNDLNSGEEFTFHGGFFKYSKTERF
jgi:hypothetical protein